MSSSNNTNNKKRKPGKTTAFFICMLIATFLWLVKSLNTFYTHSVRIPVEFKNLPQNKKSLNALPDFLTLDIKTSGLKLFFILINQPFSKLEIDFNELQARRKNYVISAANLHLKNILKFEAKIKQINPDTLYFVEKSGYQKIVPVQFSGSVKTAPGYGHGPVEIEPSRITITGDSVSIKRVDTIYTQAITLSDLTEPVEKKLAVLQPLESIYLNDYSVSISLNVEKLVEHCVYIPLTTVNIPPQAKSVHVFPSTVKIKFTALQNQFDLSDTLGFKATVNASRVNGKKSPVTLSAYPAKVNVLSVEPQEAEILIIKK